ncbi:hypothetical protein [Streptomyces sp. SID3343]|nr:hypothetical protein [Streptomyces sp. SID3343]MYV98567.1 hypothetical protein [Streptomyces sp. SID3343]
MVNSGAEMTMGGGVGGRQGDGRGHGAVSAGVGERVESWTNKRCWWRG